MNLSKLIEGLQMQSLNSIVYEKPLNDNELIVLAEHLPNNHSVSSLNLNVSQLKIETLNVLRSAMLDNHSIVTINWQSYKLPMSYELFFQEICARNQTAAIALARACVNGNVEKVESFLRQGVSVYTIPALCQQPIIHQAIATGNSAILKLIFELRPMLDLDFAKGTSASVLTELNRIKKDWLPPLLAEFAYKQGALWEREKQFQRAVVCYQLGSEKAYPRAQLQLGNYYLKGWGGLPCDIKKAHFYLKLAAEANLERAKRNLAKLESEHPELIAVDDTKKPEENVLKGNQSKISTSNRPDEISLDSPLISSCSDKALIQPRKIELLEPQPISMNEEIKDSIYVPTKSQCADNDLQRTPQEELSLSTSYSTFSDAANPQSSLNIQELIRQEVALMHEKLVQESQTSPTKNYSQNQDQFYQIVRRKLEQLLVGAMAVASGRVKVKKGLLPTMMQGGIQLLGSLLPVPGISFLGYLFGQGLQRTVVKEQYREAKQLMVHAMPLMEWVKAVDIVAQRLTFIYAEQLNELRSVEQESMSKPLPWQQSQAVVINDSPETAIELVADYAVLCMLTAMLAEKLKEETLISDLVNAVIYPEAMDLEKGIAHAIKEILDTIPLLSTRLLTIQGQAWRLEDVFIKPGIRIIHDLDDSCEYYAGNEHQPALYGYRHGTLMEVQMHPEWQKHFLRYERSNVSIPITSSISESSSSSSAATSRSVFLQSSSPTTSPQNLRPSSARLSFFASSAPMVDDKNEQPSVGSESTPIPSGFPSVLEKYEVSTQQWVVSLYRKPKGQNPDHPYILIESLDIAKRASLHRYDLQAIGEMAHVRREVAQGLALNNHDIWAAFFERFAIRERVLGVSWSVSWELGMQLIKALDYMVENHIQIAYGIRGSYCKFGSRAESAENCYTWARNKLIEHLGESVVKPLLPITWRDWIVSTPRMYI